MHWDNSSNKKKDTITIDYDFYEFLLKQSRELESLKGEPDFCQDECSLECSDEVAGDKVLREAAEKKSAKAKKSKKPEFFGHAKALRMKKQQAKKAEASEG